MASDKAAVPSTIRTGGGGGQKGPYRLSRDLFAVDFLNPPLTKEREGLHEQLQRLGERGKQFVLVFLLPD